MTAITVWPLTEYGMTLPQQLLENYPPDMVAMFPERLYPTFNWEAMRTATVTILLGVQVAALIPSRRIFGMRSIEAIRAEN